MSLVIALARGVGTQATRTTTRRTTRRRSTSVSVSVSSVSSVSSVRSFTTHKVFHIEGACLPRTRTRTRLRPRVPTPGPPAGPGDTKARITSGGVRTRVRMQSGTSGVRGAAAQPPQEGFTEPDQVKRFGDAKKRKDPRVLDIDSCYASEWMKGARILITGANRGIGLALAKEAARCGAVVVGACRKTSKELDNVGGVEVIEGVEVTSEEACEALADKLKDKQPLDVVVNNAGYFPDVSDDFTNGLNFSENLKQYDICAVGPLRVTAALVNKGCIKQPGGKVVNITSQGGSALWRQVQNANKGGDYGHHMCKAAANMCGVLMAEELRPKGIAVANLHPGFNRTEMTKKYEHIWDIEGAVESEVGAKRVMHEIGRCGLLDSGAPFINCEDGLLIPY